MRARGMLVVLVLLAPAPALAQAIAEDTRGAATILLRDSSVGVNVADASIQITVNQLGSLCEKPRERVFSGIKVKGKAANGLASLLGDGNVSPGFEAGFTLGYKTDCDAGGIGIRAAMDAAKLTFFNPEAAPDKMIASEVTRGGEIGILYNRTFKKADKSTVAFGAIGAMARRVHNYGDLDETTIVRRTSTVLPDGTVQELVSETAARAGTLTQGWVQSIDADLILAAAKLPMSVRGYVRLGLGGPDALRDTRTGIDVALIKSGGDVLWDRRASIFFEHTRPAAAGKANSWTIGLAAMLPIASIFD